MAQYEVAGVNASGKTVKVLIDCDSAKSARQKARERGITPLSVNEADPIKAAASGGGVGGGGKKPLFSFSFRAVPVPELANMTRQLATLIKAHVPIVESLGAMIEQIDNLKLRAVLMGIRDEVNGGKGLADAMSGYSNVFNRVYINMVKAGESSGRLDVVLLRLADFLEGQVRLKNKVQGAMLYPIIMIVAGFGVLAIIMIKVVPEITKIFMDLKQGLPLPTKILIAASEFTQAYIMYIVVILLVGAVMMERFIKTDKGRVWKDRKMLDMPIFGKIVRTLAVARFARSLGTLLASGVPMLPALEIAKNVSANAIFEDVIASVKEQVSQGRPLASTLKSSKEFPPIVTHMVGVGEKTGELEPMLLNVAESYELEVESKLQGLTSMLEPLMIVVMAVMVAFIVMAVLLPIFEMNQFAK